MVNSTTLAAPLLLALQREMLEREAWPLLRVVLPGQDEGFWSAARDAQLDGYPSAELAEAQHIDASLRIQATDNANALAGVDPARLARGALARGPLREVAGRAAGRSRCGRRPPPPSRRRWARRDFIAFVERALFLDRDDPVAAWGELRGSRRG